MLFQPKKMTALYLERASIAHDQAINSDDHGTRLFYERMCERWMHLAASNALVEQVDLFLTSVEYRKLPPIELCATCDSVMRLEVMEATSAGQQMTFQCFKCGGRTLRSLPRQ